MGILERLEYPSRLVWTNPVEWSIPGFGLDASSWMIYSWVWLWRIRSNDLFLGLTWKNPVEWSLSGLAWTNPVEWSLPGFGLDEFGRMISSCVWFERIRSNDLFLGLAWTNPVEWSLPWFGLEESGRMIFLGLVWTNPFDWSLPWFGLDESGRMIFSSPLRSR